MLLGSFIHSTPPQSGTDHCARCYYHKVVFLQTLQTNGVKMMWVKIIHKLIMQCTLAVLCIAQDLLVPFKNVSLCVVYLT